MRRGHPDETITASYLDGALPEQAREAFESHLAGCDPCRAGIALLTRESGGEQEKAPREMIERAMRAETPAPPAARRGGTARLRLPAAIAAAALLVVAAGFWLRSSGPPPPLERGPAESFRALSPGPGSSVGRDTIVFEWTEVAAADRYAVTVLDAEGRLVAAFESRQGGVPIPWPDQVPRPAPGRHLWSVRALKLDQIAAETRPIAFDIR